MFFRRRAQQTIVDASTQGQLDALAAHVADLERVVSKLTLDGSRTRTDVDKLELAFNAFRQRVYAWRKGLREAEPPEPPANGHQPDPSAEKAPLDKAAILRAHRSKQ